MKQKKTENGEIGDKDIIYSKALRAGQRIYYLDVKKNMKSDLFIAITESKKNYLEAGRTFTFEKHKIFLYREDFDKFINGMADVINYIQEHQKDEFLSDDDTETLDYDIQFD